jgi:hypothetical protein
VPATNGHVHAGGGAIAEAFSELGGRQEVGPGIRRHALSIGQARDACIHRSGLEKTNAFAERFGLGSVVS